MSKKMFVIKDAKEFRRRLNLATIQEGNDCRCVVADVMDLLKDYEQDVIGFEAGVTCRDIMVSHPVTGDQFPFAQYIIPVPSEKFELCEKLKVYVVKPKKPEVK